MFNGCYAKALVKYQQATAELAQFTQAISPLSQQRLDMSLTSFVDDVGKCTCLEFNDQVVAGLDFSKKALDDFNTGKEDRAKGGK